MAKQEPPLTVDLPRPESDQPAWSKVGVIGVAGFVIGIAWPRVAGVKVGPSVPSDLARTEATAGPVSSAAAPKASGSAAAPALAGSAAASESAVPDNQELVVVGGGKINRCFDKKDKKVEECDKLLFDPVAVKKLEELSKCPSAIGLSGKMSIGFEVNFDKQEVQVAKVKKGATTLPTSTVNGIVQCAGRAFANVSLDEVPHKHRRYSLSYPLTFYPPGKHPESAAGAAGAAGAGDEKGEGDEAAAGATTSETEASGTATVVDTAPLRKEPKGRERIGRLVRGTKVKLLGKQNDWYKVEAGDNVGWVYRSAIGM